MAKDKYEDLDVEFKTQVAGATDEKIDEEIRKAALYAEALLEAKSKDGDLAEAKAKASEAGLVYRDGAKACRLKVAFCRDILKSRGRNLPGD